MFTGIIQEIGEVKSIKKQKKCHKHIIKLSPKISYGLFKGASVSYNGCCLTVVEIKKDLATFNIIHSTLNITNLSKIQIEEKINIERALKINDEIGGHFMSGHIMTTAKIFKINTSHDYVMYLKLKNINFMKFIFQKGFIGIDGVSLTINHVYQDMFSISLIPTTLSMTTLQFKKIGQCVNIEIDAQTQIIVETIERLKIKNFNLT